MKKIVSMALLTLCCTAALAIQKTATPTSLISVLKTLNAQSYTVIKLEYEHHGYEASVITPQGFLWEIRFDEAGHQLTKDPDVSNLLPMDAVLMLVEKAGYTMISSVRITKKHAYKIDAVRTKDQKEVELEIDAETGDIEIEHEWWDIF